jgi:hypothetical protein
LTDALQIVNLGKNETFVIGDRIWGDGNQEGVPLTVTCIEYQSADWFIIHEAHVEERSQGIPKLVIKNDQWTVSEVMSFRLIDPNVSQKTQAPIPSKSPTPPTSKPQPPADSKPAPQEGGKQNTKQQSDQDSPASQCCDFC